MKRPPHLRIAAFIFLLIVAFPAASFGVNSPPTDITLSSSTLAENNTAGATVGTLSATDADVGQTHTFTFVAGDGSNDADNGSFTLTGSTLTINSSADYESKNSYSIRVLADDGNGGTFAKAFTITVTDVNEEPRLAAISKSGTEDMTVAFSETDFTSQYSDPESTALSSITVVSLPATGTLKLSGVDVSASQVIPSANLDSLTYEPAANENGAKTFTVTASDGSLSSTPATTVTMTLTAVNDAPVITSNGGGATGTVSMAEGTTAVTTVTATDPEVPATQTLTYSKSGTDASFFTIDSSSGVLAFAAAPNFEIPLDAGGNNVYDVTVTATDNGTGTLSDSQALAITVTDVNDAPVITSNGGGATGSVNVAENTTTVTTVTATDADVPAQTLTYSKSGTDASFFTIDSSSGVLAFAAAPNFEIPLDAGGNNVYDVTVTATDNGTGTLNDSQALAITVTDVNDAPVITSNGGGASVAINVAENTTTVTTVIATDADLPTQTLTYSKSGTDASFFTIDSSSGVLAFAAAPNFEIPLDAGGNNVYDVTVTATDNGTGTLSDSQNLAITVTFVSSGVEFGSGSTTLTGSNPTTGPATLGSGGTLILNRPVGDNTAFGTDGIAGNTDITISGGTLQILQSEQIGDNAGIVMTSGAFNFGGTSGLIETIGTFSNSGGTFVTGDNTLIGTGASITWSGGTNTVSDGGLVQDAHITITGGTNTVEGGATGGVLEVLAAGAGLEFGGTANPTLNLSSDNAVGGKLLLSGDVTVLNTLTSGTALILNGAGGSNSGTVDLNGGTRTFTINDGSGATDMLISARIINGALSKAGAGTLSLTGANTYTGITSIQAGTLSITGNINSSTTIAVNGGLLSTSGANKLANAAAVTVDGGTLTIGGDDTVLSLTLNSGSIGSGGGTLTATTYDLNGGTVTANLGAGTLNSSGNVALNGAAAATTVNISAGTLTLGANDRLDDGATVTVSGTGILDMSTRTDTVSIFNMSSGSISGSGTLTATTYGLSGGTVGANLGTGTLNSSGAVSLNGSSAATVVNITGGVLTLGSAERLDNGATLSITGSGNLAMGGFDETVSALVLNTSAGISGGGTLTSLTSDIDAQAGDVNAILGGSVGLTKTTAGNLILRRSNTYTGLTDVQQGTLTYAASDIIANSASVKVSGGTLAIGTFNDTVAGVQLTSGSITGLGGILTSSSTYDMASGSVSAILGGTVGLSKTSVGSVTLSGANTYTGATMISAGTLALSGSGALSDTSAVNVNGATGVFDISGISAAGETIGSLAGVASSSVVLGGKNLTAGGDNSSTIFTGILSGTGGSLTKEGTGTLTLNSASTYTGLTTVSGGILNIQNATALGTTAGGTTVSTGATLQLQGGITVGAEALTLNGGAAVGQTGALVNVSGTNTYGGAITVAASSSVSAASGSVLNLTGGLVKDGTTLTFNGGGTINVDTTGISGASANSDLVVDGLTVNLNVANTYNGPTFIRNSGTLNANVSGALPTATRSALTFDGTGTSVLTLGADQVVASLTSAIAATVTLNANTLTVGTSSGSTTFAGSIGGTGGLTKDGASTQTLTGSNGYTGATTISAGTLALSGGGSLSDSGVVNISGATGVFDISAVTATGETIGSLSGVANSSVVLGGKTLTFGGLGTNTTVAGIVSGTGGSLIKNGSGALTLSGANTYTGTTTINTGGTLNINHATAIGTGALIVGGTATIDNTSGAAIVLSNNNALNLSGGSLTFTGTNNLSFGTGALTISGANRTVTTSGGVLTIGSIDAAATNLSFTKAGSGGTLVITGSAGANFQGGFVNDDGVVIIGDKGSLGTGTLTMRGGTLQASTDLSGVNALTVSNWVLAAGGATFSGSNSITIGNSTVGIDADRSITNDLAAGKMLTFGSFGISTDATNRTLTITGSGDTTFTGTVSNGSSAASNLLKSGTGKLTLSAANTYAGATIISAGTLELTGAGSLSDSTAVNLNGATGVFDISAITAAGETIGSLAGVGSSSVVLGGKNLTAGGDGSTTGFAGVISGSGGSLTKTGAGTLTLTGSNTYTGVTTVNAGTLALSGAGRLSDSSSLVVSGGTFAIGTVSDTVAGVQLVSGSITGSGGVLTSASTYDVQAGGVTAILGGTVGLTKTTAGTVTLSGTNTYTGNTTLSAGGLVVNGSIGSSADTIVNGGILQGTGTVGQIHLNSGGAINAGLTTTAGALSTGSIAIVDGQLQFNLGGTGAGQYDQISATGTIDLTAGGTGAKLVLDAIGSLATTLANDALSGYTTMNALNNAFTLVSNDLTDAITGAFAKGTFGGTKVVTISGLDYVEGLLGTGYYGRINYAGSSADAVTLATAGNDIVLKIVTPEITVTEGVTTLTDNGGYDFGDVDKVIPAIPVTKTFTIKNDGEVDLMNIAITALTGVAAGDYSLNTTGTATNLIPGASTTFTVTFDPQRIGTRNAYFSITSNDLNEATFDIPLTGVGSVARDLIADGPLATDSWVVTYSGVDAPATPRDSVANAVTVQHSTTADEALAVFATGYTTNAAGNKDIYLAKYEPNSGAKLWDVVVDGGVGRDDEALAVAVDGSGDVVVAGYQTVGLGNTDVYVAKFSGVDGTLAWSKTYGGAGGGLDAAVSLALDPSGNVAVAGYGRNVSANQDVFMARYLADGTEVFAYLIDGGASRTDGANTVATDAAGNVYAAGYRNVAAGNKDCYIIKMDSAGGFVWEQTIGGTSVSTGSDDEVYSMALDATGNPVLGGTMYNSTGYDLFAAKLDAVSGAVTWQRSEDPYGFNDSYRNVLVDRDGNIVMAGVSHVTATTTQRYVSKYTTNGVLVWNARLNASNDTTGSLWTGGIALDGEENVVVTGYTVSGSTRDVYTAKLKGRDGSQLWERTYDGGVAGGADDEGRAVASSLDGYVYVAGYAGVDGGTKGFLLKHYKPLTAPVQTPQSISFPALAEQGVGGQVKLVATATSGLRVRFNVISGPGTLSGADNDLLTITGLGTVVVRASQTGNYMWAPAASVQQTLVITKQAQTITFTLPASTYYTNVVALGATASSGLGVSYSVVSDPGGVASIVGSDLSFSGPGFVTVRASQAGNGTFVAAPNVDVVIEATNTPPVIFPTDIAQRWANTFAGTGAGAARAVALKPGAGAATSAVITGYTTTAGGGRDIYTAQYSAGGTLEWQATYTGAGVQADEGVAVTVDGAGNVYVAGYTTVSGAGTDVIVIKYNSTGAEQWVRTFAGSTATGADAATSLALVGTDVVVAGYLTNATRDFFAARITGANAVTWQSSYDAGTIEGSSSKADTANKVAVDSSENIALVGNSASSSNNIDDIWTVKLDGATGTRQWHKRYNGTLNREDRGNGVGFDNVGNVLITGWTNGQASSQTYDIYTAKYAAADGALVWQATYNGPNSLNDSSRDMKVDSQGSVIVVGVSNNPQGNQDMWTGKFNGQTGALVWEMVYNNNRNDVGLSVSLDPNGNPVVTGSSADVFGSVDIYTVKYSNADGTPVWDAPGFQRYEAINGRSDAPAMVAADGAGSVYVAGHHTNSSGVTEALLVRYAPATVLPPPPLPPPPAFGEGEIFAAAPPPPPPALQLFLNVEHGDLAQFGAEFSDAEGNDTVDFTATIDGSPGGVLAVNAPAGRFTWEYDTSTIAPGAHEVVITATDTAGASTSVNLAVTLSSTHPDRAWRWENFGSTVASGNAADDADPDGDGLTNLAEFAFGLNPTRSGGDVGTRAELADGQPGSAMRAIFRRRKDHVTAGVDYVVEFSSNLGDWTPSTAIPEVIADEGLLEKVGLAFPVLPNGHQSRFFRISVQQQTAPGQ